MKKISTLKVSEIFHSIQGEGANVGRPAIFLRLSGCTRKCTFCDSTYHIEGKVRPILDVAKDILKYNCNTLIITGGEPLLQWDKIKLLHSILTKLSTRHMFLNIETNGDLLERKVFLMDIFNICDYLVISPKDFSTARRLDKFLTIPISKGSCSVKVVTDMHNVGKSIVKFASMLMPLTTKDAAKDYLIKRRVWNYCMEKNIRYTPRLHVDVFGCNKRGV